MTALAPDPALPQRDLLLDGAAMARRPAFGAAVEWVEPVRVTYRFGQSIRVLYRVSARGSTQLVALRTFGAARAAEVYRESAAAAHDAVLGALLFRFPSDRKVAGLRALVGGGELVAYAPEKSATVRIDGPGGRAVAFAKAYADSDDGERTQRVHEALVEPAALAGLTLPRATGWSAPRRTLGCEAIAGRPLASLAGVGLLDGLEGLGAALGVLHGLEPPGVAPPFGRTSRARLREAAGVIARARPDCGTAAEWLLARLERDAPPPGPTVCLHGDVHPKNAIVTPGGVALIDLDQVSSGPAAADLGSIIAALRYARVTAVMSTAAERAQGDAVLRGYAGVRELPDADELRWQVAAALLGERALRAVTRLRAPGLMRLPALLAEAGTTLRERNGALA